MTPIENPSKGWFFSRGSLVNTSKWWFPLRGSLGSFPPSVPISRTSKWFPFPKPDGRFVGGFATRQREHRPLRSPGSPKSAEHRGREPQGASGLPHDSGGQRPNDLKAGLLKRSPFCNHLKHMLLFQHQNKVGNHHLQVAMFRCTM